MSFKSLNVIMHGKLGHWALAVLLVPFVLYAGTLIVFNLTDVPLEPSLYWIPWLLGLLAMVVLAYLLSTLMVDGWVEGKSFVVTALHILYLGILGICMAGAKAVTNTVMIRYLVLFTIVELITDAAHCYDVFHDRHGQEWDRWWICTMIYPACGLLFEAMYWYYSNSSQCDVNQLYSLLAGFLSCTYMLSVYSQRLVPNKGPFKEINGVSSDNHPKGGARAC